MSECATIYCKRKYLYVFAGKELEGIMRANIPVNPDYDWELSPTSGRGRIERSRNIQTTKAIH